MPPVGQSSAVRNSESPASAESGSEPVMAMSFKVTTPAAASFSRMGVWIRSIAKRFRSCCSGRGRLP